MDILFYFLWNSGCHIIKHDWYINLVLYSFVLFFLFTLWIISMSDRVGKKVIWLCQVWYYSMKVIAKGLEMVGWFKEEGDSNTSKIKNMAKCI